MSNPKYKDLRDFIKMLEARGELKRIKTEVDPYLEMTEISDRALRAEGPTYAHCCSSIRRYRT